MTSTTSDLLDDLEWRGLVAQSTDRDALARALADAPLTLYAGFDPTAPSLHVGNLVPLLTLTRFQQSGHRPIVLAGGATGMIGDPSGRATERTLNSDEVVTEWVGRIRSQLERFVDFSAGPTQALVVDNIEWTGPLSTIDFLRDVGKHFSVNQMLAKESVSARLEASGISFTEFSYSLLQANDYLELYRRHGCRLQIGGSDQWGNITAGLDLIRKAARGEAHALTLPLVTSANGQKFGKSTGGGSLWLDPTMTSPYAFYQYWINTDDRDVIAYLKLFTFLGREELDELEIAVQAAPAAREAQRRLAAELTTLVHGEVECRMVQQASLSLFGRGELAGLDEGTLSSALAETPLARVAEADGALPTVVELLTQTGLCESRSAARRAVDEGGAYLNNQKVTDPDHAPTHADLLHGRWLVIRRGKRNVAGVEVTG